MEAVVKSEAEAVAELVKAHAGGEVHQVKDGGAEFPVMLRPAGMQHLDLTKIVDEHLEHPRRARGTVVASSLAAFLSLTLRHASPSAVVYAHDHGPIFEAVLNDHVGANGDIAGEPGWRDHRVMYTPKLSPEWLAWLHADGVPVSQAQFAEFLEEHILDLVDPATAGASVLAQAEMLGVTLASPATVQGLARSFSVRVKQVVKEARVLESGETQLVFSSEHTTDTGMPLVVPGAFLVAIPVFTGGPLYVMVARLRYRVREGQISWSFRLTNPERAKRQVFEELLQRIEQELDELDVLVVEGCP